MKKRIYIFLAFALLLSGCASISKMRASHHIKAAEKYLLEEDYEQAIIALNKAIELEPKNVDNYLLLAEAYQRDGQLNKSKSVLKKIKRFDDLTDEEIAKYNTLNMKFVYKDILTNFYNTGKIGGSIDFDGTISEDYENTYLFKIVDVTGDGIEEIITEPGGYEYQNGESSVFNGDGLKKSLFDNVVNRVGFGGQSDQQKQICFVNLREIRDIRFGTRGPVMYNDLFYGTDLEVRAFGTFSIQITDAIKFVKNFLPANVTYYSFDSAQARAQIVTEFLQSFTVALNSLSTTYRISQLPSQASVLAEQVSNDEQYAGTWKDRFGFEIIKVAIANIEFSPESKELVKNFSSNKMNLKAFDDVSQKASNIAAQQKVASGIEQHGLGDGAGMIFGMNIAQQLDEKATKPSLSFDEQIEALTKLKSLLDADILSQEEFDRKKKEIMDL